ncbi:Imm51 family immunity protein [Sorangium sp. So ce1078]|uniref:Imm51 family immunity protein n=1 Tax=Sorangium sp. So ce1078 TaxID=3133329 RepID=UPI003F604884
MDKKRIVFESSESLSSPSGTYKVTVSSQTTGANRSLSQAIVEGPAGGSGLVAFYLPRVSMGFAWNGDDELVVRYPDDLPPPRIDAANSSFGWGGRGRVIYQAVPRNRIRPLRWMRSGELLTTAEEPLERGVLLTFEAGGLIEYTYSYYDVNEPDASSETLSARGLQGGGESWAGVVRGLVALRAPEIIDRLELDPESDGLAVRSADRAALIAVAELVAAAKRDPALLEAAIERALLDGQIE